VKWIATEIYKDGIPYKIEPLSVDRGCNLTKQAFLNALGVEIDKGLA
jgi:hypothetical protein